MTFAKAAAVATTAAYLSLSGAAFAQSSDRPEVPSDAKKQGSMQNGAGSTGMQKDGSMAKGGSMEKGGMEKGGSMENKSGGKM